MKCSDTIWSDAETAMTITLERKIGDKVLALLQSTAWGSGQMRYRITDLPAKLAHLRDPHVFVLVQADELRSACILDRCAKRVLDRPFDTFHFVMIATTEESRNRGLANILAERIRIFCEKDLKRPGMAIAYIEANTEFSLRISDSVRHTIAAEMNLILFDRLWAKPREGVGFLEVKERPRIIDRLSALYSEHELLDFEASVLNERYYVLRQGSEIVAGVQAECLNWSVNSIPGLTGSILMSLLPRLPHLNRVANPRHLKLVRFGNILMEPQRHEAMAALLETVLTRHDTALGLIMMDRRSPVLARLLRDVPLGIFHTFLKPSAQLHMDFVGVSETEIAQIAQRPVMVSPADVF